MAQAVTAINPAELVRSALEQVERVLEESSASEIEVLREAARHILGAGGKRVRPQMALLAALAVDGRLDRMVPIAAACELVHTATLVHDDIVDGSHSRRGRMAAQFLFGNSASVLMGDYLVVRAFSLLAQDPERRLWSILSDTIARMCEGEVLQLCVRGDTRVRLEVYETIIECKTALLMAACTRFGGLLGGGAPEQVCALAEFGRHAGMAFQIQDDLLDFLGTPQELGKPVGGDLREGKVTLPVIYALRHASPADAVELQAIYEEPQSLTPSQIRRATDLIEACGGFERARRHAREFVERAREALFLLPESPAREALRHLAERVVDRSV